MGLPRQTEIFAQRRRRVGPFGRVEALHHRAPEFRRHGVGRRLPVAQIPLNQVAHREWLHGPNDGERQRRGRIAAGVEIAQRLRREAGNSVAITLFGAAEGISAPEHQLVEASLGQGAGVVLHLCDAGQHLAAQPLDLLVGKRRVAQRVASQPQQHVKVFGEGAAV